MKNESHLTKNIERRVAKLLRDPYAGSKGFRINHSDARYISNCHGAMVYVFNLEDYTIRIRKNNHPDLISKLKMDYLISKHFLPSKKFHIGNLLCFYGLSQGSCAIEELFHSSLLIQDNLIFHQRGTAGIFSLNRVDATKRLLESVHSTTIILKSYKFSE